MLHYHEKNMLNPLVKSVFNNGDICNFVTAVSALSNTSQRSVYKTTTRRVGRYFALGLPCAAFSSLRILLITRTAMCVRELHRRPVFFE